jgi:hypothetical protein
MESAKINPFCTRTPQGCLIVTHDFLGAMAFNLGATDFNLGALAFNLDAMN